MSTTFPNKPQGTSPQNQNDKDNTLKIILIAVIALLALALGFMGVKYSRLTDKSDQQVMTMDTLNTEIADLETKIKGLESEISNKGTELSEKDRLLEEKLQELQALQAKVASAQSKGKLSDSKAKELQGKITTMEGLIAGYRQEIDRLKSENTQLSSQVTNLTETTAQQKQQMEEIKQTGAQQLQAAEKVQQEQSATIAQKEEEKKQIAEEKARKEEELQQTKTAASVLKATDFRFFNLKKNDKEKEEMDKEFKRMFMQNVRVLFTINENAVAQPGAREVFMVYENPDGSIRTTDKSGKFKFENRDITYSTKMTVNYNRAAQEISMTMPKPDKDDKFQKGIQTVSIFCDGKMIGRGKFEVK